MKRIISIMLAFVMIFSVANISFAQENAEYTTEQAEAEALSADEEYARDVERDEIIRGAYEKYEEEDWDESTLMATYSVKGKISLPSGAKANSGDRVMIQLLSPAVIEDGLVVEEYGINESSYIVDLTKGATSVNYTASVSAKGDYILAVKYYTGHADISGEWLYYTKNGATRNPYIADAISLTSSTKSGIDLTLNAAETTISGTIDLSNLNVNADGNVWVYATNSDFIGDEFNFYCQVPVKKGAKSVSYALGVPEGNYYMEFSSNYSKYCYYTSNGATTNWSKKETFNVGSSGKVADIALPARVESGETGNLTVKVDFKADADGDKEYIIRLLDEDGEDIDSKWVTLPDGEDILEATLTTDSSYDGEIYISIKRIYDSDGSGWSDDDRNVVYYSSANGFVGSMAKATDVSGETSVTVKEPSSVTLNGDYTTEGDEPTNMYMYIGAQFEDESFCTRVPIGDGTYQIKVPDRFKGKEYEIFTAQEQYNTTMNVTLTGQTGKMKTTSTSTGPDVSLGEYTAVEGTVYLPYEAGVNGAVVRLSYDWNIEAEGDYTYGYVDDAATLVIEQGCNSVDYKLCVPAESDNIDIWAYLTLYEAAEVQEEASAYVYLPEEQYADLYFTQSARLTGTISLPYGMTLNEDVELYVYIRQESGNSDAQVVIPAGMTSVDYSINVSKGEAIKMMEINVEDTNSLVREYYYDGNSFVNEYTKCNIYVDGDLTIDATLVKAVCLEVNVTVPDKASFDGSFRISANAEDRDTSSYYYSDTVKVDSKGTYSLAIPVPDDRYAEYIVSVSAYKTDSYSGNLLLGSYYYTNSGWIMNDNDNATYVSIGDDALSMTLATEAKADIKIHFPDGVYAEEGFSANIYLVNEAGVTVANKYAEFEELGDGIVVLSFPDTLTGNVYVRYRVNGYGETNINYNEHYYSAAGPVKTFEEATAVSVNTLTTRGLTVTAPKYKGMSGKVSVDGRYKYTTGLESFDIVLESADGTGRRQYLTAKVDEELNYTASYRDIPEGEYYVNYSLQTYQLSGTNLLSMEEVQLTDENGNRVKVSTAQDTEDIDVEFRAGRAIEGTVKLPSDARVTGELSVNLRMKGMYDEYFTEVKGISGENSSVDYIIAVDPEDEGSYPIEVTVYEDGYDTTGGFSNIVLQESYYRVSDTENSDMFEDAELIDCSRDVSGVDVTIMTGVGVDVSISKPAGVSDYFNVDLYLYSKKNGWNITSKYVDFNRYNNQPGTINVSLIVPKDEEGEEVYLAYKVNTQLDSLCHGELLYVAEDGEIHYLKEDAGSFTLGEENVVEFTVAKKDEMDCVLESDHPYQTGQTYTYEYTHPEDADYLKVYFSDATSIYYSHSIEFRDENGNTIATYESYNSKGYTSVPGNSFTLVFDATSYSYYENYGFKIIKIEGADYVAESEHPYTKNDLPIVYEYTHPDKNVDGLEIHFSSNTYFGSGVRAYVYDEENSAYNIYAGVVELDGRSFRIEVQDADYGYFEEGAHGFAIEQIVPVYMHTITFKNYDGTILDTQNVRDGEYGYFYDDDMLKRESDDEDYVYIFTGWDKEDELESVTTDLVVTAQYKKVRAYKVVYKNIDGTVLEEKRVPKGEWAIYDGQTPVYPYESDVNYSFNGWDKPEQAVNEDMVFTAKFSRVYLESKHDYDAYSNERFVYSENGATSMDITFSQNTYTEPSWDYINIYYLDEGGFEVMQGSYSGSQLAGKTISIPSDTVVIYLTSDSGVQYYGFAVTDVKAYYDTEGVEMDADVTVYQLGNDEFETMVSLDLNKYIGGTAVVAAYNADGDCLWVRRLVGEDMMNTVVNAVTDCIPAEVKVMLWGEFDEMEPVIAPVVKTRSDFDVLGTGGGSTGGVATPDVG